jgi:hypothetical protein
MQSSKGFLANARAATAPQALDEAGADRITDDRENDYRILKGEKPGDLRRTYVQPPTGAHAQSHT